MKYLIILLTLFLVSCSKPNVDVWDTFWDRIDNMKSGKKLSGADSQLIIEETEKEWEEVDKQTDK